MTRCRSRTSVLVEGRVARGPSRGPGRGPVRRAVRGSAWLLATVVGIAGLAAGVTPANGAQPAQAAGAQPAGAQAGGQANAQASQVIEALGPGVTRFYASAAAKQAALPSFAFVRPVEPAGVVANIKLAPVFAEVSGKHEATIAIEEGTSLYGTGMVGGPLLRNGRKVTCWNTDAYGYGMDAESLYQSHPWVLGVRKDGSAFGVLADTTYRCTIDLSDMSRGIHFSAEGRSYPVVVIEKATPQEVLIALTELTGRIEMPPRWALGYHQCRYSYFPDTKVYQVARTFREKRIPCDVIWLDIDYMDGFRCFTFDPKHFPDPKKMNNDLQYNGFSTVYMIDPGIKVDPGYFVYREGSEGDHWVKNASGQEYNGEVWPGPCAFPDYTRAATREWWAGLYVPFVKDNKINGIWNDMNEPAVFNVPSKTMPVDNLHRPDPAFAAADGSNPGEHARFHNVYGMLMVKASREGVLASQPGNRPFVLSRANYIGGHRYAAAWTGDNTADWAHLEASIPMVLNLGLSGQPFSGPDIGGFVGNGPPGGEGALFARWMAIGNMLPFARGHTGKDNIDKEPWSFGPQVEKTCKLAIERRYRLLPYFYTLFREATENGLPVARPLFFHDPVDPALRSEDDAFLLGSDLLVVCDVVPDSSRVPALPKDFATGGWREFDFPMQDPPEGVSPPPRDSVDPNLPKLFVRKGAIIPTGPVLQHSLAPTKPITLLVHLDDQGKATGRQYSDSGDGFQYRDDQFFYDAQWGAERVGNTVTVRVLGADGKIPTMNREIVVRLLLEGREIEASGRERQGIVIEIPEP
ncbi:MAG: glycoside hydrolase family 31 protein [Planctomycetota bacterium]|nr:glycoside hydrolase family 31 protein [Planctomycetota bacterium]